MRTILAIVLAVVSLGSAHADVFTRQQLENAYVKQQQNEKHYTPTNKQAKVAMDKALHGGFQGPPRILTLDVRFGPNR